eukprot:COSAG05_NODE_1380_length_5022_cov_25.282348_6_plen_104_part_00
MRGADLQCPGVDVPLCREVVSLAAASWLGGANFGLGWGLVGLTGGGDSGEGREPLLPSATAPQGAGAPRCGPELVEPGPPSEAQCHHSYAKFRESRSLVRAQY